MKIISCDFYRMKPDILPPQAKPRGLYVVPGRLPAYVNPREWELVGHNARPAPSLIPEIEHYGYCAQELAA